MPTPKLTVLVVDDEAAHIEAVRRALEASGIVARVDAVGTVREYQERVAAGAPDVALLDLNLPDGRAIDLLKYPPEDADFPILVMTSYGNEEIAVEALQHGALDYIVKSPTTFSETPRIVERALREWDLRRERKRSAEALAASERKYRELVESARSIVLQLDSEGRITFFNEYAERFFGYAQDEVLGRNVIGVIVPEIETGGRDLRALMAAIAAAPDDFPDNVNENITRDGRRVWVTWANRAFFDDERNAAGWLATGIDITERVQLEAVLREREADFVRAERLAHIGNWSLQSPAETPTWSDEMFHICGVDPGAGAPSYNEHQKFVHPEDWPRLDAAVAAAERGEPYELELRLVHPDGAIRHVVSICAPVVGADGRVLRLAGTVQDITDRVRLEAALYEREADFVRAQQLARVGSWTYDPSTQMTTWSAEMFRICGQDPSQGVPSYNDRREFVHPDDWGRVDEAAAAARERGEPYQLQLRIIRPDGVIRHCVSICAPVVGPDGSVLRLAGTMQDVTERVQAEQALSESEHRYHVLADSVTDVIWTMTLDGRFTYVSPSVLQLRGYTPEEVLQQSLEEVLCPESLVRVREVMGSALENPPLANMRESRTAEVEQPRKDGSTVWTEAVTRFLYDAEGRPNGVLGVSRDITERRALEDGLRARAEHLAALHEASRAILLHAQMDHSLAAVCRIAVERFGVLAAWSGAITPRGDLCEPIVSAGEGADCAAHALSGWDDGSQASRPAATAVRTRRPVVLNRVNSGSALQAWCPHSLVRGFRSAAAFPMVYGDDVLGVMETHSDDPGFFTPDRVEVLESLANLTAVAMQNWRLFEQIKQAAKMESIGALAGGVAHDFNNILTGIHGYAELAIESLQNHPQELRDLERILGLSDRAADLTRQLLAFSRRQTLQPVVLNLNRVVEGMLDMLRRLVGEDVDLVFLPGAGLRDTKADPTQMEQVLLNLVANARDAMPGGGRLIVETGTTHLDGRFAAAAIPEGEYVTLTVSDSGQGMDAATRERIFEPFFTTKEVGKGTGLGLATVYGVVRQHGGSIHVYSEPGHGTTFRVFMPALETAEIEMQSLPLDDGAFAGNETILVVEDEESILSLVERILTENGYTVLGWDDPEIALELVKGRTEEIALLLTDVVMPGMNGKALYEKLAAIRPSLRVLYMSGYTDDFIAHSGVLDPNTPFIGKPFHTTALLARVRELLDAEPPASVPPA